MKKDIALKIIYWLSFLGILFSGYLSYNELANRVCVLGSCPIVAGLPACVYGFVMFVVIFVISVVGFRARK